jgi:hypothetical protein
MIFAALKRHHQSGATIVEVLVAIALTGIFLPVLVTALVAANSAKATTIQQVQAQSLLREATDAVRSVREKGWSNVATDGTYYPAISGSTWSLNSGSQTINGFTRQLVISSVQRDAAGAIVSSGGTNDPSSKHVVVTVSWSTPRPSSISTDSYLTRWQTNTAWTQTTQADFNAGTFNNTSSTNTAGGEVTISGGGSGISWASPTQVGSLNISGNTDGNDVYVDTATNRAYVVNGATLSIINVSNPAAPTLLGTYNPNLQLNGVYVVGNYAYLASSSDTAELTVVNVTTPTAPTLAGSLNLGDTADATSVFVTGGYAYVGKVLSTTANINEFYVINVATPTAPTLSGSMNLTGTVNSVFVVGNYAYLATAVTTAELTVVDVTTKTTPTSAGVYNSAGTVAATDVFHGPTYLYMTELTNSGGPEFFVLDTSNPASVSLVGTYEAGANVNGVSVYGNEAFLATSINTQGFTVLDLSTVSSPVFEGSSNTSTNNDIFFANDTAYVASTANSAELAILQGSASSGGQAASGTYESPSFDTGNNVGFNYLTFTTTLPVGTTITFQIAVNNDNATWNYVGPDGTALSSYSAANSIPLAKASGRYFRYKATLDTPNKSNLPVINDVTLNYSP